MVKCQWCVKHCNSTISKLSSYILIACNCDVCHWRRVYLWFKFYVTQSFLSFWFSYTIHELPLRCASMIKVFRKKCTFWKSLWIKTHQSSVTFVFRHAFRSLWMPVCDRSVSLRAGKDIPSLHSTNLSHCDVIKFNFITRIQSYIAMCQCKTLLEQSELKPFRKRAM